jgi:hypothetical protein
MAPARIILRPWPTSPLSSHWVLLIITETHSLYNKKKRECLQGKQSNGVLCGTAELAQMCKPCSIMMLQFIWPAN